MKLFARKIQQPYNLTNTALVFNSSEGAGKDLYFNWFDNDIIGSEYYINTEKPEAIFGKFNSDIENKILVVMNEASGKDTFSINENIKCAITAIENGIEHKGMKRYKNKNNIGYIFLTNNDNPLKVPVGDRRFYGIECNNSICNNKEYFDALRNEMNTGDYNRAFYDYWMSLDINNYDFTNNRPETSFYNDTKELNTPVMVKFLEHIIDINSSDNIKSYTATELYNYFNSYLSSNKFKVEYTSTKFGLEIKKI